MSGVETLNPERAAPQAPAGFGLRSWLRWFWRQLTSMRVALILLFLLAVASIPGSLFPQRGIDPLGVEQYLVDHPTLGPWLDRLSMFDVYAAPWFAAIYLLLCISLAGCIIPRTMELVATLRRPPPPPPSRLNRMPGYAAGPSEQSVAEVVTHAQHSFRDARWRVRSGDSWVAAEKGYLREVGNLLFHLALLGLLAAVAIGSLWGWRASVIVTEGRAFSNTLTQYDSFSAGRLVERNDLSPFTVELVDFQAEFQRGGEQNGAPRDYRATVNYRPAPGEPMQEATIAVNGPLTVSGAKVFLTGHGYAPVVRVTDAAGLVAFDGPVVFLPQDGNLTSTGVVKVPDAQPQLGFQGIFLPTATVDPERGPISVFPIADDPALFLSAWKGDLGLDSGAPQSIFRLDVADMEQIGLQSLLPGETWTLPDGSGTIEFVEVAEFANFAVARDPGKEWALGASIAAMIGLMLSLFVPRRRMWVRAEPATGGGSQVAVAGLARTENADVETEANQMLEDLVGPERDGAAVVSGGENSNGGRG